ncbi:MAG: N-acetylmuramoyl-L-alanine amidase [Erysipelotrichaceae bacterium]|nr:N-acetylmuramoyl-L-alanine amidase [Erysipelotrichaceae bacterium]MDO4415925.1 N-acetylmuramoyl-L-alanine amidase [Erysipelotrichaceae bacterium]
MKTKKLKYSFKDPMVMILCGLLVFLTIGCLMAGKASDRIIYNIELDAAFGGANKGFVGYIAESDINEKTVNAVEEILSKDSRFDVHRTHEAGTEASVNDSAAVIEKDVVRLVLSIHGGYDPDETVSGTRIYTNLPGREGSEEAKKFADAIAEAFNEDNWKATRNYLYYHEQPNNTWTIEVTDADAEQPDFGEAVPVTWTLLEKTKVPCVIVEQFFVSNKTDIGRWDNPEGYQQIAEKYYSALCNFLKIQPRTFEEETEENQ